MVSVHMRLDVKSHQAILACKDLYFGCQSKIYLFGSRTDLTKKGGDLDLFLIPTELERALAHRFLFLADLELRIGFQKIDLVISSDLNREIEKQALSTGVLL